MKRILMIALIALAMIGLFTANQTSLLAKSTPAGLPATASETMLTANQLYEAGQFAQAYSPDLVRSCIRQLLFVRPGKVVVVDQLVPPPGGSLPEVQWLLQVPKPPEIEGPDFWVSNGRSWLRCRALSPGGSIPSRSRRTPLRCFAHGSPHRAVPRHGSRPDRD